MVRNRNFTATVTITNLGPSRATTVVSALTTGGFAIVDNGGGRTFGSIGASVTYTVTLRSPVTVRSRTLHATSASAVSDPSLTNNAASAVVRVVAA